MSAMIFLLHCAKKILEHRMLFFRLSRAICRFCSALGVDSWSIKHVSDAHEDQNILTDSNGRRRGDCEEKQCLVGGRGKEKERGVDYRQDAGELRSF